MENSRLIAASGLPHATLHKFARKFGLTKSEKGIKGIKKRQAAHIKQVCEENGYYDDLTERSPVFEKNLKDDGFKVKKWGG